MSSSRLASGVSGSLVQMSDPAASWTPPPSSPFGYVCNAHAKRRQGEAKSKSASSDLLTRLDGTFSPVHGLPQVLRESVVKMSDPAASWTPHRAVLSDTLFALSTDLDSSNALHVIHLQEIVRVARATQPAIRRTQSSRAAAEGAAGQRAGENCVFSIQTTPDGFHSGRVFRLQAASEVLSPWHRLSNIVRADPARHLWSCSTQHIGFRNLST